MSEEAFRIMTQMDLEGAETQAVAPVRSAPYGDQNVQPPPCPGRAAEGGGFYV